MKVAVVFLFTLVAISTQQQLMWLVPYVSPQSYYNNMQMRDNGYNSPDDDYSQVFHLITSIGQKTSQNPIRILKNLCNRPGIS